MILSLPPEVEELDFTIDVTHAINRLWSDSGVQTAISNSKEFKLNDSAT